MSVYTEVEKVAVTQLQEIQQREGDAEVAHVLADDVLCNLLIALGFKTVVDEWRKVERWYA